MSESMVHVRGVTKIYERGKQKIEVLHELTLDIPKGDFVSLMGPSGSGKTTLLNLIGGLDKPSASRRPIDGLVISGVKATKDLVVQAPRMTPVPYARSSATPSGMSAMSTRRCRHRHAVPRVNSTRAFVLS